MLSRHVPTPFVEAYVSPNYRYAVGCTCCELRARKAGPVRNLG